MSSNSQPGGTEAPIFPQSYCGDLRATVLLPLSFDTTNFVGLCGRAVSTVHCLVGAYVINVVHGQVTHEAAVRVFVPVCVDSKRG